MKNAFLVIGEAIDMEDEINIIDIYLIEYIISSLTVARNRNPGT